MSTTDPRPLTTTLVEPVEMFAKLVREVEAGQVLIAMTQGRDEATRAALDALALARDVLDDARAALVAEGFPAETLSSRGRPPSPARMIYGVEQLTVDLGEQL